MFELAHGSGTITAVASFNGTNGAKPGAGLILDGNGNLYGTTVSGGAGNLGTVFEVTNPGTTLAIGGFPSPATAGAAGSFTVTARNADGTTDTAYTGTVHFTSSDPRAVLPADYTFTAADAGVHTFSASSEDGRHPVAHGRGHRDGPHLRQPDGHRRQTGGGEPAHHRRRARRNARGGLQPVVDVGGRLRQHSNRLRGHGPLQQLGQHGDAAGATTPSRRPTPGSIPST